MAASLPLPLLEAISEDNDVGLADMLESFAGFLPQALAAAAMLGSVNCVRQACSRTSSSAVPPALMADRLSWTPLHHAAQAGHEEVLSLLLATLPSAAGVDVRTEDARISRLNHLCGGVTPLHLAAGAGELASVELLLEGSADPGARDANDWDAADHAKSRPQVLLRLGRSPASTMSKQEYDRATKERNEARAKALTPREFSSLASQADDGEERPLRSLLRCVDTKNLRIAAVSVVQAAVTLGSAASIAVIVEALQQQGKPGHDPEAAAHQALPGLNDLDKMGLAPLHAAVETGFTECIAPLLEARADPDLRTADASYQMGQTTTVYVEGGRTALHLAVERRQPSAVAVLLQHGAGSAERSSFGQTPREVAEGLLQEATSEASFATGSRSAVSRASHILEVLGASAAEVSMLSSAQGGSMAKARRLERGQALRRRIAEASQLEEGRSRAADMQAVRELYLPLDAKLVLGDMGPKSLLQLPSTAAERRAYAKEPVAGVFVFPLLNEEICARLWAESEHYTSAAADSGSGLPLPVRHDGCLDLSRIFPAPLAAIAEAARPAIKSLLPPELHSAVLRHAFRTKNFVGREETFARHVDKYAVTLNVCVHRTADVAGSGVFFYASESDKKPAYHHQHSVGMAVLHSSKEWHETELLTAGERGSIIMWFELPSATERDA